MEEDKKKNLLLEFCGNECKFSKNGCCEELIGIQDMCYCPAEHFADWMSEMFQQLAFREIWNGKQKEGFIL
jgi:hypothetical protein